MAIRKGERAKRVKVFLWSLNKRRKAKRDCFFRVVSVQGEESELGRERPPEGPFVHFFTSLVVSLVHFVPRIIYEYCN